MVPDKQCQRHLRKILECTRSSSEILVLDREPDLDKLPFDREDGQRPN